MSDEKSDEFLKLLQTSFDTATDIARAYIDTNIIKKDFKSNFIVFLERNKHDFFTRWSPRKTCCCCPSSTFTRQLEQFDNKIFTSIYQIDYTLTCKSPKPRNGVTKCVCQIVIKQDVSLESLDIGALACIMKQYGKVDVIPLGYINKLREVRNELCHTNKTDAFKIDELEDKWICIETAMNGLLDEMNISTFLRKLFTKQIEDIKSTKNKTTSMIKSLSSIGEKVDSRLASVEKEIKNLKKSIGQLQRKPSNVFSVNARLRAKKTFKKTTLRKDNKSLLAIINSKSIDETKVIQNLSEEISRPKTDEECSKSLNITNIEHQCIRFDLEASPELFANVDSLKNAVDDFINKLLIAGEVDINKPGTIEIEFIVNSQLSEEEMMVVKTVFDQDINCSDDKEDAVHLNDGQRLPEVKASTHAQQTEKKHLLSDSGKTEDEFTTIQSLKREFDFVGEKKKSTRRWKRFKQAKVDQNTIEKTNEDNVKRSQSVDPDMSVEMQSHAFSLYFVDIPEHLERFVEMSEAESSKNVCVQWSFDCPPHWNISDLVDDMNKNMVNLKGWFKPMLIFQDKETGRLILQCNTQHQLFSSYQQFKLEVRNFIELIEDKCQLQTYSQTHGDKREDVGISLSVIMPPDGYLLEDDPKNLISETEKEPLHGKRTDLDKTLLRLGVKKCLEIKYKEYSSKCQTEYFPGIDLYTVQSAFYSHLKELARNRKRSLSLSTRKVIRSIQSNLSQAVSEYPELDLFDADKYIYSCGNCSSSDVICWCRFCKQLYCFHCLTKHHTDMSHRLVLDDKPCPALTFIYKYDIRYEKEQIIYLFDMKVLDGKLLFLGKCKKQLKLVLWKDDVLYSKLVADNHDEYVYWRIAVIDSYTCAVQSNMLIIIFTIKNSMINELLRIQMDKLCRSLAHVNGILYVGTYFGIIKMTLEGNKVGEIKCENLKDVYANGTQIYYTTDVRGQYVNVIDTTRSDTMRSLDSFRTCPDQMDFTSNGNIVFLKYDELWFTCNEGQCNCILIRFDYFPYPCFSLSNDEIYSATKDNKEIKKYKLNEEMLTQLTQSMSQLSTSSGTSFQKSLQDPGISAPVTTGVSVPLTSVSIAQTTTAEEQGGVVNLDIEPLRTRESYFSFITLPPVEELYHQAFEVPGSSNALQNFPPDHSLSQMGTIPVFGHQSLPEERDTQRESVDVFQPFSPPISYSDAFRQVYSNPGPSQPPYIAPPVHTYGRPPHSPPGDDNITSDENLSDESRD